MLWCAVTMLSMAVLCIVLYVMMRVLYCGACESLAAVCSRLQPSTASYSLHTASRSMTNAFFLLPFPFILLHSSSSSFLPPSFFLQDAGHQVDNTGSTEARHDKLRSLMKQDAFDINKVRLNNLLTSVNNILTMTNRTCALACF